jgi:hypothetical protein
MGLYKCFCALYAYGVLCGLSAYVMFSGCARYTACFVDLYFGKFPN